MNKIKPVYQVQHSDYGRDLWIDCKREKFDYYEKLGTDVRVLYPAAAYEALQKENEDLQLRLDAKTLSHQLMLDRTLGLQKENCDQKRKIIGLENELVEWNEFKKIRDAQMQALRKQMP